MIKIEISNSGGRKAKALATRKREYAIRVLSNIKSEIDANPELLESVYCCEEDVAFEIEERVNGLLEMEKQAEKMRGGWIGDLRYKLAKK
jgi:hypothetical protein